MLSFIKLQINGGWKEISEPRGPLWIDVSMGKSARTQRVGNQWFLFNLVLLVLMGAKVLLWGNGNWAKEAYSSLTGWVILSFGCSKGAVDSDHCLMLTNSVAQGRPLTSESPFLHLTWREMPPSLLGEFSEVMQLEVFCNMLSKWEALSFPGMGRSGIRVSGKPWENWLECKHIDYAT